MHGAKRHHADGCTGTHTSEAATHQFRHVRVVGYVEMAGAPENAAMDHASRSTNRISDLVELLVNAAFHPLGHLGVAYTANLIARAIEAVLNSLLQEHLTCKQGYHI